MANYGPTDDSIANGCAATNLDACAVKEIGNPDNWFGVDFDYSDWDSASVYTSQEAGWGRTPSWVEGQGCCTATSPVDRSTLALNSGCSVNYNSETGEPEAVDVLESECLDPRAELSDGDASFLWGSELEKDNRVLFRYTVEGTGTTTTETTDASGHAAVSCSFALAAIVSLIVFML